MDILKFGEFVNENSVGDYDPNTFKSITIIHLEANGRTKYNYSVTVIDKKNKTILKKVRMPTFIEKYGKIEDIKKQYPHIKFYEEEYDVS